MAIAWRTLFPEHNDKLVPMEMAISHLHRHQLVVNGLQSTRRAVSSITDSITRCCFSLRKSIFKAWLSNVMYVWCPRILAEFLPPVKQVFRQLDHFYDCFPFIIGEMRLQS